jgi:hypothetical protein
MDTEKHITVKIPPELQAKLDNDGYSINGTQVRDNLGRIVCNLKSLEAPSNLYFSPQIFISFEQYCFISISAASEKLKLALEANKSKLSSLEAKIDTILERQTGTLIALTTDANEHFSSLMEKSNLTDEKIAFTSGVKAASAIAADFASYINDYLDSTEVQFGHSNETIPYGAYRKVKRSQWENIKKSKFRRFMEFDANYLAYSLLSTLNNLNLLSLTYNGRIHPRYEVSLQELERQLKSVLTKLVNGMGDEEDIFSMIYATLTKENIKKIDFQRVLKYEQTYSLNDLIMRSYSTSRDIKLDQERINSIGDILDLLDDIENLQHRVSSLTSIQLASSPDVAALKSMLFGSNDA